MFRVSAFHIEESGMAAVQLLRNLHSPQNRPSLASAESDQLPQEI